MKLFSRKGRQPDGPPKARDETTGAVIGHPPGWDRLDDAALAISLAWPEDVLPASTFRATVTVGVERAAGGENPFEVASRAAVVRLLGAVPGLRVLSVDWITLRYGQEARRIVSIYREPPFVVELTQWVTVVDGIVTTASLRCGIERSRAMAKTCEYCIGHFEPATRLPEGEPATSQLTEVARDEHLLALGSPIEDLGWIRQEEPYLARGPQLGADGGALLIEAMDAPLVIEDLDEETAVQARSLIDHGLLTPGGTLSERGWPIARTLHDPILTFRIDTSLMGRENSLQISVGAERAVVLASPSPGVSTEGQMSKTVTLEVVEPAWVPGVIASWTGLAPAWTVGPSPDELPRSLLLARAQDSSVPPPSGANSHLTAIWAEPWVLWRLSSETPSTADDTSARSPEDVILADGLLILSAGRRGTYRINSVDVAESAEVVVKLVAAPSFVLWQYVRDIFEYAVRKAGQRA